MVFKPDFNTQRLHMMELLLLWEGRLNRGRLMSHFGLAANSASVWIREFREYRPTWLAWDTKTRSFHATPAAYREWQVANKRGRGDATSLAQYLALAGLPYATTTDEAASSGVVAAFPDLSTPLPDQFAAIAEAIRSGQKIQFRYRSMQHPEPHERLVSPHHLIRAGRRWHVRGYCDDRQDFRDFSLGRMASLKLSGQPVSYTARDDAAWYTTVSVRLDAHPGLTKAQEDLIRFEYFGNTAGRVETCRGALVAYFIQDVRAAIDYKTQVPPDYQLIVRNVEELRPWLFPT